MGETNNYIISQIQSQPAPFIFTLQRMETSEGRVKKRRVRVIYPSLSDALKTLDAILRN